MNGLVLYHRVPDPASARVRARIVALGGGLVPALRDGRRLVHGADAILSALDAIIPAEERSKR